MHLLHYKTGRFSFKFTTPCACCSFPSRFEIPRINGDLVKENRALFLFFFYSIGVVNVQLCVLRPSRSRWASRLHCDGCARILSKLIFPWRGFTKKSKKEKVNSRVKVETVRRDLRTRRRLRLPSRQRVSFAISNLHPLINPHYNIAL